MGNTIPELQLALDFVSLPSALKVAVQAGPYVDIVEIGTPLCKAAGVAGIAAVREILPDKKILADFKSPDCGGVEAMMAHTNGANYVTVLGSAPTATIQAALAYAKDHDIEVMMELTGVTDIIGKAKLWRSMGVERLVYHRGWDEEAYNRQWDQSDLDLIQQLIDMGYKLTATGGITAEKLPFFKDLDVAVIIAGREIHAADDPAKSAQNMKARIAQIWG